ncbi:MAG: hypothetical protein ACK5XN_13185 [Bacteroidota bacterium]|jgi:hypothetical protein
MNAKERLLRITRAQNSLLRAKNHLRLAQNSIRKEYDLCVQEAADADGFVADCDERIERAGSWDGAQPDAFFGKSIKWRRCDSRDFGRLVRVSLDPIADPLQQPEAKLIGIDYGPDGDIEAFQCEGSKGQAVHWKAAWVQLQDGEELRAPPNGRRFTRIHMEGVDFSAGSQPKDSSLWDVIAEKWHLRPLDLVYLVAPPKWAQWPTWRTLHDLVLRNHRFVIDPEAEAKVSETGEIAIKVLGLWVNVEWLHVDHSFRAKAAQLLAKDHHWEPTTFGEAMLANRPPAEPAKEPEPDHPAWEPKVGDWVRVTRPKTPEVSDDTLWLADMDRFDGAVMQVEQFGESYQSAVVILAGYAFKVDWLAPAEAPEPEHPAGPRAVPRMSPGEWLDIRDAYRDATAADVGKLVYVRNGEIEPWSELRLAEVTGWILPFKCTRDGLDPNRWQEFRYAVIRNEGPAKSEVGAGYRHPIHIDLGEQCEFSAGLTNPNGSLVWGIFARLMRCQKDLDSNAIRYYTEDGTYYHHCRVKVEG